MQIKNTPDHFGIIAILFHWVMAMIIIGLLVLGIYMVPLPITTQKLKLYRWHKEYGILILFLAILRMSWRLSNILPLLPSYLPNWQKLAARGVHFLLYILMFGMPVTGWMMSSATGFPVSFFGWFVLPDLISPDESMRLGLTILHKWLGYGFIALICLHSGATLQHYILYKDNILRRILP